MVLPRKQQKEKLDFLLIVMFFRAPFQAEIPNWASSGIEYSATEKSRNASWPREQQNPSCPHLPLLPLGDVLPTSASTQNWVEDVYYLFPSRSPACMHVIQLLWFIITTTHPWTDSVAYDLRFPVHAISWDPLWLSPNPWVSAAPSFESLRCIPVIGGHQELAGKAWALESGLNFHRSRYSIL